MPIGSNSEIEGSLVCMRFAEVAVGFRDASRDRHKDARCDDKNTGRLTAEGRAGTPNRRAIPRIALVLGSGGIRSAAGIGVAEVLGDAGYAPDLVVGCSSGAIFGAAIASGLTAQQALDASVRLWSQELTEQTRWGAYLQLLAPRIVGFGPGFALRDATLIERRLRAAFGALRLESLPIELRVATTDAQTGHARVITEGSVVDAVRASAAVPFIFPSVEIDGRRHFDGVLSDPLPVGAAHDAAVVITLGFEGAMPRRINRVSRLVAQTTTAMINNLQAARTASAHARAAERGQRIVEIKPHFERRIGLWQTSAIPHVYEAGRRAAHQKLGQIEAALAAVLRSPQRGEA